MAIDVTKLADYSFEAIQTAAKVSMMSALLGGSQLSVAGVNVGRVTPDEARKIYDWATEMIAARDGGGMNAQNLLVQFGRTT